MDVALFKELLDKYMAENATEAECLQLNQLLQHDAAVEILAGMITADMKAKHYNNDEDVVMKTQLLHRITHNIREQKGVTRAMPDSKRRLPWLRYAAAAAIILIAATTWLFYNKSNNANNSNRQISQMIDVSAGHNGAILTLADGRTILLDSAANGAVAIEANTTIIKNNDGSLVYQGGVDPSASQLYHLLSTPAGRQFSLSLPDGSKVWLNAASSLKYPVAFNGSNRTVEVTGEAYFEIVHNAAKPFFVKFAGQQIQVLGTSFNVNAYANESKIRTTLLEGSIRLSAVPRSSATPLFSSVTLRPGQQASVSGTGSVHIQIADLPEVMAWKNGLFSFRNADLKSIMRQLARWYDVEVQFEGDPGQEQFTGKIGRNLSLREVMEGLAFTHVKYRIEAGKRIVVLP